MRRWGGPRQRPSWQKAVKGEGAGGGVEVGVAGPGRGPAHALQAPPLPGGTFPIHRPAHHGASVGSANLADLLMPLPLLCRLLVVVVQVRHQPRHQHYAAECRRRCAAAVPRPRLLLLH